MKFNMRRFSRVILFMVIKVIMIITIEPLFTNLSQSIVPYFSLAIKIQNVIVEGSELIKVIPNHLTTNSMLGFEKWPIINQVMTFKNKKKSVNSIASVHIDPSTISPSSRSVPAKNFTVPVDKNPLRIASAKPVKLRKKKPSSYICLA